MISNADLLETVGRGHGTYYQLAVDMPEGDAG